MLTAGTHRAQPVQPRLAGFRADPHFFALCSEAVRFSRVQVTRIAFFPFEGLAAFKHSGRCVNRQLSAVTITAAGPQLLQDNVWMLR